MNELFEFDALLRKKGYPCVCGTDEAGAGPLAGAVYAAAVILGENTVIDGLNDSKKLSEKKREDLYEEIIAKAEAYAVASVDEREVDRINILNARMLAMRKAVLALSLRPDILVVDGNSDPKADLETLLVVGGDGRSACIAAASVLAKVSRDRYICALSEKYPEYSFEKHKGYGTKIHIDALKKYGPCPIHRLTFISKILKGSNE